MRSRRVFRLAAGFAVALAVPLSGAQQLRRTTLPPEAAAEIDQLVRERQATAKIPGLSVAIAFGNAIAYSKGFGAADLENGLTVTPSTRFRTASVAKPMTATAVMQLVEAGRIRLDAPIQEACPAFPAKPWPVTARQILGHLAGIRHYKPSESAGTSHYFSIEDSLTIFKNDPLLHEPGMKYLYSTFGYSVLGCAIEGAARTSYEQYMRDHIWQPAGMTRTRLDRIWDIVPERARPYQLLTAEAWKTLPAAAKMIATPDTIYNGPFHDTSMKVPGGGLLSTAEDLVRFGLATMHAQLVRKESLEQMWTEGKTTSGEPTGYGLGWGVIPAQEGVRRMTHSGNQVGASSVLHVLPEVGLTYAIMTNLEDAELGPLSRGIAQILRKYLMS